MVDKGYQYKLYDIDGTFKRVIDESIILDNPSFNGAIDSGQWSMTITLALDIDNTDYENYDVVRVYEYDTDNVSGRIIYTWFISRIRRVYDTTQQIQLDVLGIWLLLNRVIWYSWGFVFTKTQDPAQTIKDMIDYFNTKYTAGWLSYAGGNIVNYWSNISIEFDHTKWLDVLNNIVSATQDYYRYIDAEGQVYYDTKVYSVHDHIFRLEYDCDYLSVVEDGENIVNKLYVDYGGTPTTAGPYEDATSQTDYWLWEKYELKSDLQNVWSANTYWNSYITQYKDNKMEIIININTKYDIESIRPWQFVKLLNCNYSISELQIARVDYSYDGARLYLSQYTTLQKTIYQ